MEPSKQQRVKFFITGVVLPAICFLVAFFDFETTPDQPWQSGKAEHYFAMLITWPGFAPVLPILGFSAAAMATWCFRPSTDHYRWVRIGLYGGVVLAVQFFLCVLLTSQFTTIMSAAFAIPVLAAVVYLISKSGKWMKRFTIRHLLILTTLVAVVIAVLISSELLTSPTDLLFLAAIGIFFLLVATPTMNLLSFVRASMMATQNAQLRSAANQDAKLNDPMGITMIVAWFVAWGISWKLAVDVMLIEYAKLPVTDPNCYVSSAAANGHRRLVGSKNRNGCVINQQMQRLKFLEFALSATSPRLHRLVRQIYNQIGPPLARACALNRWFSDATFLLLKPLEWTAEILRAIARVPPNQINRIYTNRLD